MIGYWYWREKENRAHFLHIRRNLVRAVEHQRYSRWIRLRMKGGTIGPGIEILWGGYLLPDILFRSPRVTLMMKRQILFNKMVMAVI